MRVAKTGRLFTGQAHHDCFSMAHGTSSCLSSHITQPLYTTDVLLTTSFPDSGVCWRLSINSRCMYFAVRSWVLQSFEFFWPYSAFIVSFPRICDEIAIATNAHDFNQARNLLPAPSARSALHLAFNVAGLPAAVELSRMASGDQSQIMQAPVSSGRKCKDLHPHPAA